MPVGAYGGKKKYMDSLAPEGPVYQAGTLSGNPMAMAAGYETVSILKNGNVYNELEDKAKMLEQGLRDNLKKLKLDFMMNRVGSIMGFFFTDKDVHDFDSAMTADTKMFTAYFTEMMNRGIYLAPSQFEASFLSSVHTEADIFKTVEANYESLKIVTNS